MNFKSVSLCQSYNSDNARPPVEPRQWSEAWPTLVSGYSGQGSWEDQRQIPLQRQCVFSHICQYVYTQYTATWC